MAKYTVEFYKITDDPNYDLWDNNTFPFFTDDPEVREEFKRMFEEMYWNYEIGQETVGAFKRCLYGKLRQRSPYFAQLYKSELVLRDMDFMVNKDYRETFMRTMDTDGTVKSNGKDSNTSTSNGKGNSNTTGGSTSNDKGSDINDGVSTPSLDQNFLTSVSSNDSTDHSNTSTTDENTSTSNGTNSNDTTNSEKVIESYVTEGKGNIGITSASDLGKGWRSIMLSTVEEFCKELKPLFMLVY